MKLLLRRIAALICVVCEAFVVAVLIEVEAKGKCALNSDIESLMEQLKPKSWISEEKYFLSLKHCSIDMNANS